MDPTIDVGGLLLTDAEFAALCWPRCWWQEPHPRGDEDATEEEPDAA